MPKDQYAIRIDPDMMAEIEQAAAEDERTRSDEIRRLLRLGLDARKADRS